MEPNEDGWVTLYRIERQGRIILVQKHTNGFTRTVIK